METLLSVHPASENPSPRVKPAPKTQNPLRHVYHASEDGTDENLLILLHGLGDTHVPFSKLGKQLHLPQTATLSLRAPEKVPYLYEEAYQWYESFDSLGELLARPNPTHILDLLENFLKHLMLECRWPGNRIHLFGFGQGGSVAAELGLRWWKAQGAQSSEARLGSIVSVAGPLLSYPTPLRPCPTPVLIFHRRVSATTKLSVGDLAALKKGYEGVQEVQGTDGDGMLRSKEEWEPVMRFWSANLSRRNSSGLYEISGGGSQ